MTQSLFGFGLVARFVLVHLLWEGSYHLPTLDLG